jgi:hypothetical protein
MSFPARRHPRVLVTDARSCYWLRKGEVVQERDGELQVRMDDGGSVLSFVRREVLEIVEQFVAPKMRVEPS